jgi:hypothetical protein
MYQKPFSRRVVSRLTCSSAGPVGSRRARHALACLLGLVAHGVWAADGAAVEPASAPAPATAPAPAPPAAAPAPTVAPATPAAPVDARDALAKKEGDVDQAKLLKETLTAADKQYSMLKQGKFALTYDLSYTYIG